MKTKRLLSLIAIICIASLFSVDLAYAYHPVSPYAYCNGNPIKYVDPDGRDYYESKSGAVIWQDDNARKLTINDEKYKNIGASYSQQMVDGSYVNSYQGQSISISATAMDARQIVLNNPVLAGTLLSTDSPLSSLSQQGLIRDMIHQAQGKFIKSATDFGGTVLETGGNGLAAAGYAVSATGVGAGVGAAMSGLGNAAAGVGTGLRLAVNMKDGDYGQAVITVVGAATNFGVTKLGLIGSAGSEQINAGINLFFTPMNTMINNIQYNRRK